MVRGSYLGETVVIVGITNKWGWLLVEDSKGRIMKMWHEQIKDRRYG